MPDSCALTLLAGIRHAAFRMRNHDAVAMLRCAQSPPHVLRERRAITIDERSCRTRWTGEHTSFGGRPRYDFFNRVSSWRKRGALAASIASSSAAHARYIEDARTKAGLQEEWKNC